MPTYTIVANGTFPLGPNEIEAGGTILANDGDIFIFSATADDNVRFDSATGTAADIDIIFEADAGGNYNVEIRADLTAMISTDPGVDVSAVNINAGSSDAIAVDLDDNSQIGNITGSSTGADTLIIGDGVTVDGNIDLQDGNNQITIGNNNTFNGTIDTGTGADVFVVGNSNDFSDSIDSGDGDDSLSFGDSNAIVDLWTGNGADTLRVGTPDLSSSIVLDGVDHTGDDGDPANDDTLFIELTGSDKTDFETELNNNGYTLNGNIWEADGATDYHVNSGNLEVNDFEFIKIVCFAAGTRIETDRGMRPIEWLRPGSMVRTRDHGFQPIRWIGMKTVPAQGHLAPYIIEPGVLDNSRRVILSPQHRVMLSGWQMELLFGEHEVLAPIKMLENGQTIRRCEGRKIRYVHMLFDRHEIVYADGLASESFHPGTEGMSGLEQEVRDEIFEIFPELGRNIAAYGPVARRSLRAHEAALAGDYLGLAKALETTRAA